MKNMFIGILSLVLVSSCGDMAKKVDSNEKLSADLVMNNKTAEVGVVEEGMPAFTFEKEDIVVVLSKREQLKEVEDIFRITS